MIFVTVGTHEQQFDRLIEYIDQLKKEGTIKEEVVMQTGYCTYEPQYCEWKKLYPYKKMLELVEKARIVITHGGPSSFIMALQIGKKPIVVPRQKKYEEHVNDHQVEFALEVQKRMGTIITIVDIEELKEIIMDYNATNVHMEIKNNNKIFNEIFAREVNALFSK